jgi:acyl-CoA dehydrogenase
MRHYLKEDLYLWADGELDEFGRMCAGEIDERAVHTDRDGQPRLIKYNRFGDEVSEIWVNEGYKKTVEESYNRGEWGIFTKRFRNL